MIFSCFILHVIMPGEFPGVSPHSTDDQLTSLRSVVLAARTGRGESIDPAGLARVDKMAASRDRQLSSSCGAGGSRPRRGDEGMARDDTITASRDSVVTWHGLGALELAFPCVTCSFVVIILLLCFCCCPLLLYRLRNEIGYDYLALLYSMLGLVVFGVVGEVLLVARRRGRLACCCRREEAPRSFSDPHKPAAKAPLCGVHAPSPRGPPPAYDSVSINNPASQLDVKTSLQPNRDG